MQKIISLALAAVLITTPVIPKKVQNSKQSISKESTVEKVNSFDYVEAFTTGISTKQFTVKQIQEQVKNFGKFDSSKGMSFTNFKIAMNQEWEDVTEKGKASKVTVDIATQFDYKKITDTMKQLSKYDGVMLIKFGHTAQSRDMLSLEIDRTKGKDVKTIILTGNIHAREGAGTPFILKELADLLSSATEDTILQKYLEHFRIVAVPCVNPDGRDGLIYDQAKYTASNGSLWKAYINGTDGNRNFPGVSWGQIVKGNQKKSIIASKPDGLYYPGDSAGSCSETRAMMKLLYHYIIREQAVCLIDYHQQGRIAYAGKPWQTSKQEKRCEGLANYMLGVLNKGNKIKYVWVAEEPSYGLSGEGSTLTDFACSLATGAKFSPAYGFCVYTDNKSEYPLIMTIDLEKKENKFVEANSKFATMTFEIGAGSSYLGFSNSTRKQLKTEYSTYHFDQVLPKLFEYYSK